MTQSALIARLRKAELQLDAGCGALEHIASRYHEEMKGYRKADHDRLDSEAREANSVLADLRELIKEVEGQEAIRYGHINPMGVMTSVFIEKSESHTEPLYTALGEKP